jgi:Kef-type K+ transport system membrane component KefB/CBS domain-containing protein
MLENLMDKISLIHINMLFLLGLALFGGTIGGRVFQKIKIPQVVGYIIIGIIIGQTGFNIVDHKIIQILQPFNYFALGLIGFMIGGELKKKIFVKYGKQFMYILLFEGITAFILVSLLIGFVGSFFLAPKIAWALGLLIGAIASATAPAATTDVLWEYKTKGPLTTTILGIVAMDDGLSLILFAIATSMAGSIIGQTSGANLINFIQPVYEIFGSIIVGLLSGLILSKLLKRYSEADRVLAFSLGMVLLVLGISIALHMDMLLAAMALGMMVTNYAPRKSKDVFALVGRFTPPIYVLFFVLVGAKLNVRNMPFYMLILAIVYLLGRTGGKMLGANLGAKISGAPIVVQKYLPLCLFSQAGVAIGLSILAGQRFEGEIGNAIVVIITGTTFVVQLLGPPFVKLAVEKAGEVGLNITEEDLINQTSAKDIMDKNVPLIYENMSLSQLLSIFSDHENLYYPVVDSGKTLLGTITIDNIKNALMVSQLNEFLLAHDLMEPVPAKAKPENSLPEVKEKMKKNRMEYMPIVSDDNTLEGFLEARAIENLISKKLMELRRKTEELG